MAGDSPGKWSDTELADAVAASVSWRGLMRADWREPASQSIGGRTFETCAKPQHRWLHAGSRYADLTRSSQNNYT
jgi:hypothetical protein